MNVLRFNCAYVLCNSMKPPIPEREAWLYENPKALASVRQGLDQARKRNVTKTPPDLKAAAKLAAQLED